MTADNIKLIDTLDRLIVLLVKYGEESWARYFIEHKIRVEQNIMDSIVDLTRPLGGMSSFHDLVICKENGHEIVSSDIKYVNEELHNLYDSVRSIAIEIRSSK